MKRLLGIIAFAAILMLCLAVNAESIDNSWTIEYQPGIDGEMVTEITPNSTRTARSSKQLDVTMPSSITRGEDLIVTINNPDGFTFNRAVMVEDIDNELVGWSGFNASYTATLPAYYFDVGTYTINISATDTETSERVSVRKTLTVTGTNGAEGPTITADKTSADINETVVFTISMSGAEKIASRFVSYVDGSGRSYSSYNIAENANSTERLYSCSYSNGTLVCYARAYINGAWTAESRCEVTINEAPKLAAPAVTVPSDVEIGKPFQITVSPVDHAEKYYVIIEKDNKWIYDHEYTEAGTYTLPALDDPGEYELRVYAMAKGYEDSDNVWKYINAAGELVEGPVVTSDKQEYEVKEDAVFTAVKEGAVQFRFKFQSYREDGTMYSSWESEVDAENGTGQYTRRIYSDLESKTLKIYVRALVNDAWTAATTITVKVKKAARLNTPAVTVPNSPHEAGVPVRINITEVEGAAYYSVYAGSTSNYNIYYSYHFEEAGENELMGLADPGTYSIEVTAYPAYDNQDVIESLAVKTKLTLTGTLANGPTVWADNASIPIGSDIRISAQMEGAEEFYLNGSLLNPDGRVWSYNYANDRVYPYNEGQAEFNSWISDGTMFIDKVFVAKVRALVNGKWTAASEVRVTITDKDKPAMLAVDFDLPTDLRSIEDSAFMGVNAKAVYVHDGCSSIGEYAFANSSVQQIRIPKDCSFQSNAFDGCDLTLIIAPEGGIAEKLVMLYCLNHPNCQYYWEH